MTRKPPSLKTKLAATLLQMVRYDEHEAAYVRVISYEESKTMTAEAIIAKFHFDHGVAHAHAGEAAPWNLTPMPVEEHRIKTATIDVPRIAKAKRLSKSLAAHQERMRTKEPGKRPAPRGRIQSRGFDKGHRPMQSRGFR